MGTGIGPSKLPEMGHFHWAISFLKIALRSYKQPFSQGVAPPRRLGAQAVRTASSNGVFIETRTGLWCASVGRMQPPSSPEPATWTMRAEDGLGVSEGRGLLL